MDDSKEYWVDDFKVGRGSEYNLELQWLPSWEACQRWLRGMNLDGQLPDADRIAAELFRTRAQDLLDLLVEPPPVDLSWITDAWLLDDAWNDVLLVGSDGRQWLGLYWFDSA